MDIIITGEQGAGKTRTAEKFLSSFRPKYGKALAPRDVLYVPGIDCAKDLVKYFRDHNARAVVFDGVFTTPNDLLIACEAVKEYRKQINADVLAIYIDHGANVMITNGVGCTCSVPEILPGIATTEDVEALRDALGTEGPRLMGSLETSSKPVQAPTFHILEELIDQIEVASHGAAAVAIAKKIIEIAGPVHISPTIYDLDAEERVALHEFLLSLLRSYE